MWVSNKKYFAQQTVFNKGAFQSLMLQKLN
jgi:hypothetical protein